MDMILLVLISLSIATILLIVIVLLQSEKAEGASIIQSGNSDLFVNRKERGGELFITRLTYVLGIAFFVICIICFFVFIHWFHLVQQNYHFIHLYHL